MIKQETGDLFDPKNKVIAHGCNCIGVMGAGVAKLVKEKHPIAFDKYKRAIDARVFNIGYAQFVVDEENDRAIYNLATQRNMGDDATLWGCYLSFCNMLEHAKGNNVTKIHVPQIGAGIGGLEWDNVQVMLNLALEETGTQQTVEVTVVVLPK